MKNNIFDILQKMFGGKDAVHNALTEFRTSSEAYKPNCNDIRIVAGNDVLIITDDKQIGGLWAGMSNYDSCSGSIEECLDAMKNLIEDNYEDACNSLIFKLDEHKFLINIADCINTGPLDRGSSCYGEICEDRINVFYPTIKYFVENYGQENQVGLVCLLGGGTSIGLSFLIQKLVTDGFHCFIETSALPFQKHKTIQVGWYDFSLQPGYEEFDCIPLLTGTTLQDVLEKDVPLLLDAMKDRVIERMNENKDTMNISNTDIQSKNERTYNGIVRPMYTPERIGSLKEDEIFVFGSNLAGMHFGGAARTACSRFGAVMGKGVGLQGQSYAIPTMQGGVEKIKPYVDEFIQFAERHEELFFYVTRIGCGIAGFNDEEIAPLFANASILDNVCLPKSFTDVLKTKLPQEVKTVMYGQMRTLVDLLKALNCQEPIKNADDAENRLTELIERNVRYGDEYAFMAVRTIRCLMSQYEQEGKLIDFAMLEKDLYECHKYKGHFLEDTITNIFYNYSVSKLVKYIQFLNDFRRYTDYRQIEEDLPSIGFSHCSSNDDVYYYSFNCCAFYELRWILADEWDNITRNGQLDNQSLEDTIFGRYERMLKEHGIREMIQLAYGQVGCHPDLRGPIPRRYNENAVYGPYFRIDGNEIEKGCSDFRRWPFTSESFEMKFAHTVLENDVNYVHVNEGKYDDAYIPVNDYSLPVYSRHRGKIKFETEEEKLAFIKKYR